MLEKPRIADTEIIACLKESYGLSVTALEFLPLGYDSYAGVYRVCADGQDYFLKAKRDTVDELSISIPRYLKAQGIEEVVAPLLTITQELWGKVGEFSLILYPFIEGNSGKKSSLSDSQWQAFGAALKKIHTMRLPAELAKRMPREPFIPHPRYSITVHKLQATVKTTAYDHPAEKQVAAFWIDHYQEIATIIERTEHLGNMLRAKRADFVLCHADIHTGNLLLDAGGQIFVVDWDQPILAPIERDLLFVTVGGFVSDSRNEALFFEGYGKTGIDLTRLAYYRYARVIEDLGGFAESVFFMESNDGTKQDSADWITRLFEPHYIVEAAHQYDHVLFG